MPPFDDDEIARMREEIKATQHRLAIYARRLGAVLARPLFAVSRKRTRVDFEDSP